MIICVVMLLGSSWQVSADTWIQRDSVNGPPKGACVAFSLDDKGYIGLGYDIIGPKRSIYAYDISTDDWDKKQSLGGETGAGLNRGSAVAFASQGNGYVGLGSGDDPFFGDFWKYDPVADTWTQVANFGGTARRQAVGFSIDEIGYVGTGYDQVGYTKDFWKYTPGSNTWEQIADFGGTARKQAVGFAMGYRGYVGTGDDGTYRADFWEYSPNTDVWTAKASFPGTPRYGAIGCGVYPNAIVGTGYDNTLSYTKDMWEYNSYADAWTQKGDFAGSARTNAAALVVLDRIFVGTGYNGSYLDDFYEYEFLLGIEEQREVVEVAVFPNPSSGRFTILSEDRFHNKELTFYDAKGRQVEGAFQIYTRDAKSLKVRSNGLTSGRYYFTISEGGKRCSSGSVNIVE